MKIVVGLNDLLKNIDDYNELTEVQNHEEPKMYSIILLFDEVADWIAIAKKEIEDKIKRLAAKARAAGIYLILATQRPTSDIITGTIKANMSSRIALMVKTAMDSRIILDDMGAECLLGNGDMIFAPFGGVNMRVQGGFISGKETRAILDYIKNNNEARFDPEIEEEMFNPKEDDGFRSSDPNSMEFDPILKDALRFFILSNKAWGLGRERRTWEKMTGCIYFIET